MAIDEVLNSAASYTTKLDEMLAAKRNSKNQLDKNAFLQLFVAQMSNQNPLEPTSDSEFIAQLAQFSTLEQMQQLTEAMTVGQAYGLVGKYVYVSQDMGLGVDKIVGGRVDGVIQDGSNTYLVIGEGRYKYSSLIGVAQIDDLPSMLAQNANFVGKTVKAEYASRDVDGNIVYDSDNNVVVEEITGVVEKIILNNDSMICAVIDGIEVPVDGIREIHA